jgi:aryl-phospho-beta-D-glucosidase BglC (GH1 family)
MKTMGVNMVRLPLGYWNLVDMQGNPNAPSATADRMGHLKDIMKASEYRPYIDQITNAAKKNDI